MSGSTAVVVIDPQRAFVGERGTFARAYGLDEIEPLRWGLARLADYLDTIDAGWPVIVVRSEYPRGARCADRANPLSRLCAPESTEDTPLTIGLRPHHHVVTKHGLDASGEPGFGEALDALPERIDTILVCGVTTTTCVRLAARGVATGWAAARPGRRVVVVPTLTAARRTAYCGTPSAFQRALADMREAGIRLELTPNGGDA